MLPTILLFLFVAIAAIASVCYYFYQSPYNIHQTFYALINRCVVRFLWRGSEPPELPVPRDQGVVLFSNHRSSVDPCFIQVSANRIVHWLVAEDFKSRPFIKMALEYLQVIEVKRNGQDTAAMKKAIRYVKEGRAVGIFPEGRINMSDEFMMPILAGAVIIALKGRVPIVPVYIEGSPYGGSALSPFFMRAKVTVRYGKPIDLSKYYGSKDLRNAMGEIAIQCAKEVAKLAGHLEFEPQLAGKNWRPGEEEITELNSQARRKWKQKSSPNQTVQSN